MLIISSVAVLLIFLIVLIIFVRNSYVKNIAESFFILTIAAALFTTTLAILLYYAKYSSSFYLLNKFLFLDYNLLGRFARVNVTLLQISDLLSMSRIFFMIGLFGFLLSITGDQEVPPSRLAMIVMVLTIILMLLNLSPIYILCMHIIRRSRVSLTSAINVFDLINKASMVPAIILLLARWMSIRQKAAALEPTEGNACLFFPELDMRALRELVNAGMEKCAGVCAAFTGGDGDWKFIIGSRSVDLKQASKTILAGIRGRGGGSPEMIQGSCSATRAEIQAWFSAYGK